MKTGRTLPFRRSATRRCAASLFALALFSQTARFATGHGDIHMRIERIAREAQEHPDSAEIYVRRGHLYQLHERWDEAIVDYDRARRLDPEFPDLDLRHGKALLGAARYHAAIGALTRYVATHPRHPDALLTRARALDRAGQHGRAASDYTAALTLMAHPSPDCFIEHAHALAKAERVEEAIRCLDEAITRLGPLVSLQSEAVDLELRRENYEGAIGRVDILLGLPGHRAHWLTRKAEILLQAGRTDEANAAYRQALDAVHRLPTHKRRTRAVRRTEDEIRRALLTSPP